MSDDPFTPERIFGCRVIEDMTMEEARMVRHWRVEQNATWRAVAAAWFDEYAAAHPSGTWNGSQILGQDLCIRAAELHSEDALRPPWN